MMIFIVVYGVPKVRIVKKVTKLYKHYKVGVGQLLKIVYVKNIIKIEHWGDLQ